MPTDRLSFVEALPGGCYAPVARALSGLAFSCLLPEALRAALPVYFSRDAQSCSLLEMGTFPFLVSERL